jgi:hypothetical protein
MMDDNSSNNLQFSQATTPESMLRVKDCEVARTAEELIAWIESVHDHYDRTKNYEWIEKRLLKPFYEEIVPLGDLAWHKYLGNPDILLRPNIGNQSYDAEIIDRSSGNEHIMRVEFTSTFRDDDLALRMEYMALHGAVFMSGKVWRDGTKASGGQIHVVPECEDYESRFEDLVGIIRRVEIKQVERGHWKRFRRRSDNTEAWPPRLQERHELSHCCRDRSVALPSQ